jgi:DNA polymerase
MTEAGQPDGRQAAIARLYQEYADHPVMSPLARSGRRLISGHGPVTAPLVIVGEAPGEDEERAGEPFTGAAGKRLRALTGDAGIAWDQCYVANVVPWRPPHNRTPYIYEIVASAPRIQAEVALISPVVVIAAGAVAFQALTSQRNGTFPNARGKWMRWAPDCCPAAAAMMLSIWHPAALLRERRPADLAMMEAETTAALASVLGGERVAAR